MIRRLNRAGSFDHVEAWIFDLDNTLYPADCNLFAEIDARMGAFISERFNMSIEAAQRLIFLEPNVPARRCNCDDRVMANVLSEGDA